MTNMSSHVWYKARIKRNANGNLEVKNQPYRIQSTEYVKIGEAMVSATNIRTSNTEATIPTVIGRICDLGDEFVVGMFISEMLANGRRGALAAPCHVWSHFYNPFINN